VWLRWIGMCTGRHRWEFEASLGVCLVQRACGSSWDIGAGRVLKSYSEARVSEMYMPCVCALDLVFRHIARESLPGFEGMHCHLASVTSSPNAAWSELAGHGQGCNDHWAKALTKSLLSHSSSHGY